MNWHYRHINLRSFASSINSSLRDAIRNLDGNNLKFLADKKK